jgi:hypothetical protein
MTEVNGLQLACRGFVTGLAAAYVWTALAMALAWILLGNPLAPLEPAAAAIAPLVAGSGELTFVIGLAVVQAAGGLIGMCFAYFFARFFTVRATLAVAAPCLVLLAWLAAASAITALDPSTAALTMELSTLVATLGYGAMLGVGVPTRPEVLRRNPAQN